MPRGGPRPPAPRPPAPCSRWLAAIEPRGAGGALRTSALSQLHPAACVSGGRLSRAPIAVPSINQHSLPVLLPQHARRRCLSCALAMAPTGRPEPSASPFATFHLPSRHQVVLGVPCISVSMSLPTNPTMHLRRTHPNAARTLPTHPNAAACGGNPPALEAVKAGAQGGGPS